MPESQVEYASHLNQCSVARQFGRRDRELLRVVEPAAVQRPDLAADAASALARLPAARR